MSPFTRNIDIDSHAELEPIPISPTITAVDEKKGRDHEHEHDHDQDFIAREKALLDDDSAHEVGLDLYRQADQLEFTTQEANRVRRKIDWIILPMFCITQGLAYIDKTALNYGKLFGMNASQHITTAQYSWYASVFYIAYLFSAWPANILLQRYSTGKVMGTLCVLWGAVSASMAGVRNFGGGVANRFFLGMLEAGVTPGLGLMTPLWWTLSEQPVRHLSWYCFNGVASIIGSLLSYGLGHATKSAVPSWALIFITFGVFTSVWGIVLLIFLPDTPASARFLSKDQRVIAVKRVAGNRLGTKNTSFKLAQVSEAFRDPKLYILFVASIAAQIPNGVVSNFSTTIISGFGFDQFQTTLLDIPSSVIQIVSLVLGGYLAGKFPYGRVTMMFVGNASCIIAACCLTYAPRSQTWGRLVAFWFTNMQSVGFALSLVMVSANVGGYTKRQTIASVTFVGYCVGNIAGPHVIVDSEKAAGYPTATKAMLAGYVVKTSMHLLLGAYMFWDNKRRDKKDIAEGREGVSKEDRKRLAEEVGMTDATEWSNPYFRYTL